MAKKQFMVFLFGTGEETSKLSEEERNKYMDDWREWHNGLGDMYVSGEALHVPGKIVKGPNREVTDGMYVGHHEEFAIGGWYLLQADSMDAALEAMQGCPTFDYDGVVEIREVMEVY